MKYLIVLALIAVAAATPLKPTQVAGELAEIEQIIAAINSPSTDPATGAALQAMLNELLGIQATPEAIAVGPTLVPESVVSPPVIVSPGLPTVPVAPETPASSPLVQIIVNVVGGNGVGAVDVPVVLPDLVSIVEQQPDTVNVVDQAPETVHVVDQAPETVEIIDVAPEAVQVVQPNLPVPVINVPDSLN